MRATIATFPALAAALLFAAAPSGAQAPQPNAGAPGWVPEINTSAVGEVRTTPDRATIVLGVETRAATAAAAGSENAARQSAVIAALRRSGAAEGDITTVSYTLTPDMQYDDTTRMSRVVGYVARNMVRVQVKQIARVGAYIDAAIQAGANGVNSLDYSTSRAEEFRRAALRTAMQRACNDAAAMAESAGGQLGSLIQAASNETPNYPPVPMYARAASAMANEATPISAGEMTLTVTVQTRWQFVTGGGGAPGVRCSGG